MVKQTEDNQSIMQEMGSICKYIIASNRQNEKCQKANEKQNIKKQENKKRKKQGKNRLIKY